jgi:3-hydroxyisobutyrate dehydrogenase-like beta-hydroxyacid dehydrogenase
LCTQDILSLLPPFKFSGFTIILPVGIMAPTKALNIGFAGLGAMGFGMASHLVKLGHQVTGFDVYEPSLAKFKAAGGQTTTSPREAAEKADFFLCMVANSQQAESVLFDSKTGAVQGISISDYSVCRHI